MVTIATTDRVDRDGLLEFVRPRHQMTLMTTRRDGRPQMVALRIGLSDGSTTEVVEGDLHEGDALIVDASTTEPAAAPPTGPGGKVRRLF